MDDFISPLPLSIQPSAHLEIRTFLHPAAPHLLDCITFLFLVVKSSPLGQPRLFCSGPHTVPAEPDQSSCSQTCAFFPPGLCLCVPCGWHAVPHPFAACPLTPGLPCRRGGWASPFGAFSTSLGVEAVLEAKCLTVSSAHPWSK